MAFVDGDAEEKEEEDEEDNEDEDNEQMGAGGGRLKDLNTRSASASLPAAGRWERRGGEMERWSEKVIGNDMLM